MDSVNDKPRVLGHRYEVGDLLGRGGMAEVHIGRDTRLGRVVAIKLLRTDLARDATFQARFRREAQSAAALNHPAIVSVYDTGEEQVVESGGSAVALPYIVMEYIEGHTLRELMHDGQPLDIDAALRVTARVLSALEYSHRAGIVHRDIKPANVMMTPNGDIKVMDFGIARAMADASSAMTQTQAVIGTAQYLSPEQARGETVDARSDLYSAGCLLYELLTGRPPFVADSPVAVAYQHVREEPQPPSVFNPTVPEVVDRIVLHALAKDRETRYQTAADFRGDLEAALEGRPVSALAAAAAAGAATTQFIGAPGAGTRTMQPVTEPVAGYGAVGGGMLPGSPVEDEYAAYSRRDRRPDPGGGTKWGPIVALGVALLVVAGLVGYVVVKLGQGTPPAPAPKKIAVVNVIEQKVDAAKGALTAKGFTNIQVKTATNEADPDTVFDQNPKEGASILPGDLITLSVSSGPGTGTIPTGLKGKSQDEARQILEEAGFKVKAGDTVDEPNLKQNQVVKTKPEEGQKAEKGSTVELVLATGLVELPNLKNKTYPVALNAINALGLKAAPDPQFQTKEGVAPFTVLGTNPGPGRVPIDQVVTIIVAQSPTPSPSPSDSVTPDPTVTPTP